jgi:HEAT repeat protein
MKRTICLIVLLGPVPIQAQTPDITGGMLRPDPLSEEIRKATAIFVLEVEKVNPDKGRILFRKVTNLKGRYPARWIPHELGSFSARQRRAILRWARPGQRAVCFATEHLAKTCLGNFWWYCRPETNGDPWSPIAELDEYPAVYLGPVDRLCAHIIDLTAGRKVVVTAREFTGVEHLTPVYRDWLRGKKGRVWRIEVSKESASLSSYTDNDPVGWGVGGPEVVTDLVCALKDKDCLVRAEAAVDLGQLGKDAQTALPALRAALGDPDVYVRIYAAEALLRIDPKTSDALPSLVRMLTHKDAEVRLAAAGVLAELGPVAQPALPALVSVLYREEQTDIRRVAAFALGELGPDAGGTGHSRARQIRALGCALQRDDDAGVRLWAVRSLLKFGADARAALPALAVGLRDKEREIARTAASFCPALVQPRCQHSGRPCAANGRMRIIGCWSRWRI